MAAGNATAAFGDLGAAVKAAGVPADGLGGIWDGTGNVVGGDATAFVDGGIGASSTNCLVNKPGGQPGTSISSATLVKSRSLNGK